MDTDAVIDFLKGVPSTIALVRELNQRGDELCVCGVVVAETYAGLSREAIEASEATVESFIFLDTPKEAAKQAGLWRYHYARLGRPLPTTDTLIAGTASYHEAVVLTGNVGDFPMTEIEILSLPRN